MVINDDALYVLRSKERNLLEYGVFASAEDARLFVSGSVTPWDFEVVRLSRNEPGVRLEQVTDRVAADRAQASHLNRSLASASDCPVLTLSLEKIPRLWREGPCSSAPLVTSPPSAPSPLLLS